MSNDKYILVEEDYDSVDQSFHNTYDSTQEFADQIKSFLSSLGSGDTVLNIGGNLAECKYFLANNLRVTDVDISKAILDYIASKEPRVKTIKTNIKEFEGPKYNGIWACRSLIHIPPSDIDEVLKNIYNLTEEGSTLGCIFFTNDLKEISVDEKPEPHASGPDTTFYCILYPPNVIKTKFERAGFKIIKTDLCIDIDKDKAIYLQATR